MSPITSIQNPRVKNAVRLRDRRHREKQGRILIDGSRELLRAIDAGVKLLETFVCRPLRENEDSQRLLAALPQSGGEVLEVSEAVFEKLAFGRRTEGVLGVAETPRNTLDSLSLRWGGSSTATPTGDVPHSRFAILHTLRELGYEVGSGVMIGIPGQTFDDLPDDI